MDLLRGGEPPLLLRARRTFLAGDGLTGCDPDLLLRRLPGLLLLDGDLQFQIIIETIIKLIKEFYQINI